MFKNKLVKFKKNNRKKREVSLMIKNNLIKRTRIRIKSKSKRKSITGRLIMRNSMILSIISHIIDYCINPSIIMYNK